MNKEQAIEKLNRQIEQIDPLKRIERFSPDFKKWCRDTEIVIEKILCHDGTRGLAVQVNGNDWLSAPEAKTIPYPQWRYQHHFYPEITGPD